MVFVVSEDDGFSWTPPKWTNIWGYPAETIALQDGRYLMIYGYRRPPYGVKGVVSNDGLTWDVKDSFVIPEGGVPGARALPPLRGGGASTGAILAGISTSATRAWPRRPMARSWPPTTSGMSRAPPPVRPLHAVQAGGVGGAGEVRRAALARRARRARRSMRHSATVGMP